MIKRESKPFQETELKTSLESNTPNIPERLQSMSPTNKHRKQRKSLSRAISKTRNANDDKQLQKINELEEKMRKLKATQNITSETTNIDQTNSNNPPQQNSKNGNAATTTN